MNDALGYIRVSSEEQGDSGLGLEGQRQLNAAYCNMKGLHLAEVFEDAGISGGKPLASRPAGSKLLAAAKKGKALVIVSKLDRLFRSVADAANVIADLDKKGIRLVANAETRFYVVRAEGGITKEISFPHPLSYPPRCVGNEVEG